MTTFPYSQHTIKNKMKMFYLVLTQNSNCFPENHLDLCTCTYMFLSKDCMHGNHKKTRMFISLMKRVTVSKFREL